MYNVRYISFTQFEQNKKHLTKNSMQKNHF